MKVWQLQEAKAHLSQLVQAATHKGMQQISLRGVPAVVVLSVEEYERLTKPKQSFTSFMRHSPLVGAELKTERDKSLTRDIKL